MRIFFIFCTVFIAFSSSQSADQTNSVSDDVETYFLKEKGQPSDDILEELINALTAVAPTADADAESNWKPPKQIEEPVNNIPARGTDAAQPSLTDTAKRSFPWELEERGRLAALNKTGVQDGGSSESNATGIDPKTYCKQDRLPFWDPRTNSPMPCSVSGAICPSGYSCDAMTSTTDGFCCINKQMLPSVSSSGKSGQEQKESDLDYCRVGYYPLMGCRENFFDTCTILFLQGAICDTTAKLANGSSGFCCFPAMKTSSTSTTTTTTTTTTTSSTSPTSTSSTASTTTTSLRSDLYCGTKDSLIEIVAFNDQTFKRCSTSSDCSRGFDCDRSGTMAMIQVESGSARLGYCCSKLPIVIGTTTTTTPKTGNAAGTILLSSGMIVLIVIAALVSYSFVSK